MIPGIIGEVAKEVASSEIKSRPVEGYKNIKPETNSTVGETNKYWTNEIKQEAEAAKSDSSQKDGHEYFDDNGIKYRDGDRILPNAEFDINGYKYVTDDKGRVVSAEGTLRIRDAEYVRNMEDVKSIKEQEYKPNDDRGHLIAHQFGGSDKLENLVPMDAKLNQGDFAKLENTLADAVKDGADVRLKVEPVYEDNSTRPSEFRVSYSIDGDKEVAVFKNESEARND